MKKVKWTNEMREIIYNSLLSEYGEYSIEKHKIINKDLRYFKRIADTINFEYKRNFSAKAVRQQFSWAVTDQKSVKGRYMRVWIMNKAVAIDCGFIKLDYEIDNKQVSINIVETDVSDTENIGKHSVGETFFGDSYDLIKQLPDNSIDLVLIDPPYILDKGSGGGNYGGTKQKYHKDIESKSSTLKEGFDFSIFDEYDRVCKIFNAYIFCNAKLLIKLSAYFENHKDSFNIDILTIHKTNPIPTCNNKYLSDTEYIMFVRKKGAKLFGDYYTKKKWFNITTSAREFDHPTIKPMSIVETLITNSTKEGDVVLDSFAGSGTTGVACMRNNRQYIMYECDENYIDIINTRIALEEDKENSIAEFIEF